jgi:hypothetical protein
MLTFKFLIINDVTFWKSLLTSVLTFNLLAINDVTLVDLYMRYMHMFAWVAARQHTRVAQPCHLLRVFAFKICVYP